MVKIGGLEQTANASLPVQLGFLGGLLSGLAILSEELRVIAGELLQADEEVAQVGLELGNVVIVQEEAFDEILDLNTGVFESASATTSI